MLSNKEIARWLREAALMQKDTAGTYRRLGWIEHSHDAKTSSETFYDRASLVEQMRCKTCRWWGAYIMIPAGCCTKKMCPVYQIDCGSDFSCCHWEEKQ